jgi:riboflavin synthase
MYSGITCGLFEVTHVEKHPGLITYKVKLSTELLVNLTIGASIAIDGTCQTVVAIDHDEVTFNAMQATLERTTLCDLYAGRKVSVERSLRYGDEIGGHEVAGHVIGTAIISKVNPAENNLSLTITCLKEWMKYILPKGFIAVDGSSLTIGDVDPEGKFTLHLIPETLRVTNFSNKKIGDRVNIELDHRTQAIVTTVENFLQTMKISN